MCTLLPVFTSRLQAADLCVPLQSSWGCCALQDYGGDTSLDAYMQLPVSQYYELDPAMIKPLGGNRFSLLVPRVDVSVAQREPPVTSF